jgi:hypothetical protein
MFALQEAVTAQPNAPFITDRGLGVTLIVILAALVLVMIILLVANKELRALVMHEAVTHFPGAVGLPLSAMLALALVLVLQQVAGDIELKAFGIEFKGAAGPILMWILCFMAAATGLKMVYPITSGTVPAKDGKATNTEPTEGEDGQAPK